MQNKLSIIITSHKIKRPKKTNKNSIVFLITKIFIMKIDENSDLESFVEHLLQLAEQEYKNHGNVLKTLYIFTPDNIQMVFLSQVENELAGRIRDPFLLKRAAIELVVKSLREQNVKIRSYVLMADALCPKRAIELALGKKPEEAEKYPTWEELIEKYGSLQNSPKEYVESVLLIEAGDRFGNYQAYLFRWNGKKFEKVFSTDESTRLIQSMSYGAIFKELIN